MRKKRELPEEEEPELDESDLPVHEPFAGERPVKRLRKDFLKE